MKICIDAGHYGKYNQSPCNRKYYESDMTWKLHNYLKAELIKCGFEIVTTRINKNTDLALEKRGKLSKGCKLFLSLHSNAGNTTADYSMACCLINDKTTDIDDISADLGKKLADKVTEIMTGKVNKGTVYRRTGAGGFDYYGVLRGAKKVGTPAILLEHGFHTNAKNTEFLLKDENLKKIAVAEAEIIADYFKVSAKAPAKNQTAVAPTTKFPYKVKVLDDCLNIRKSPSLNAKVAGTITNHGVYTIVAEQTADGIVWGKLKSGVGWISTKEKYVKKL